MEESCQICRKAKDEIGKSSYYLFETEHFRVRHSDETKIAGYLIIEAKRHFLDLSMAKPEETAEFGEVLAKTTKAVRQATKPMRVYTFSLAEAVPHFHMHVIPRQEDMPKRYVGRGIMSYPLNPPLDCQSRESVSLSITRAFKSL